MANLNASPTSVANLSALDPDGTSFGQSSTDLISFYGATPLAQQSSSVTATQQLINLGLLPVGTVAATNTSTVAAGATKTLTAADNGKVILLDTAAGSVVTLPAATGSGITYRFLVTVIATSNSHKVQVANATDFMIGIATTVSDDAPPTVKGFAAANSGTVATNSDTITLNRTTTGSTVVGESFTLTDIVSATWQVRDFLTASTGTEATPFTAAV